MWPLQTNLAGNWRGFPPLSTHGSKHCAILLVLVFISKPCSSLQASPGYCWGTAPLLPYGLTQLECQSRWASVNLHWRKSKWKSHRNRCCHWGCLETGWANSSKYTLLSNSYLLYPLRWHGLRGLFQSSISPRCYDLSVSLAGMSGNGIDCRGGSCTSSGNQDNTSIRMWEWQSTILIQH